MCFLRGVTYGTPGFGHTPIRDFTSQNRRALLDYSSWDHKRSTALPFWLIATGPFQLDVLGSRRDTPKKCSVPSSRFLVAGRYIGPPGTVIFPLGNSGPKSVIPVWPTCSLSFKLELLPIAADPLVPMMHVAPLCGATLSRWGTSSPGPKFTAESKVRWSSREAFSHSPHLGLQNLFLSSFSNLVLQIFYLSSFSNRSIRCYCCCNSSSHSPLPSGNI